jgi:sterol desaturase/sphingolipid hydroxylase (fatty acid hydroxylase superfamily)
MLGYLWYVSVHHIVHHWKAEPGTYAYALKRRHMLHHHFDDMGNFGVTSGFWDRVFGTDLKGRRESEAKKH